MEFKKYQHIERFGNEEVQGIDIGMCYIFPKIDGTNSQLWWDNGLHAGSRNRELSLDKDNAGFLYWVTTQQRFYDLFSKYPKLRLYGEWLIPHTLKSYQENAWREFYVFDVIDGEEYILYEKYKNLLDGFGISYIPPICKVENPTYDRLINTLERSTFLIKDGEGSGEGIVIKNYDYKNKYGETKWAKIVKNEFKTEHTRVKGKRLIEQEIIDKYITLPLCEKEYGKINLERWSSRDIPELFNRIYYSLITEDIWNMLKDFKRPTINFKLLYQICVIKIKQLMPELF